MLTATRETTTAFRVLGAISFCHLLNDMMQSVIPAVYPILKQSYHLDFGQIGLITLTSQLTASLLQPLVGLYTDHRPTPYSLPIGMTFTMVGLILIASAPTFGIVLASVAMVGMGSAVFHPESSRVARMASGGQHGLAQSLFQVGGNAGSSMGPLLAAFIVLPAGQHSIAWFSAAALLAIVVLMRVGTWYKQHPSMTPKSRAMLAKETRLPRRTIAGAMAILIALVFSKYFYMASLISYYTFYLIARFHISVQAAQMHLFVFLGAVAAGTIIGGPVGDRIGRKYVIWWSILGVLPFTLAAAVREPVLDGDADGDHRPGAGVGVLGDSGLRAGAAARQGGNGLRSVLRPRVRNGRSGRGAAGQAGGREGDRVRVPGLRIPAGYRTVDRVPTESQSR